MHPSPLPSTAAPARPPATSRRSWMTVESVSRSSSPFMPSNAATYQTTAKKAATVIELNNISSGLLKVPRLPDSKLNQPSRPSTHLHLNILVFAHPRDHLAAFHPTPSMHTTPPRPAPEVIVKVSQEIAQRHATVQPFQKHSTFQLISEDSRLRRQLFSVATLKSFFECIMILLGDPIRQVF